MMQKKKWLVNAQRGEECKKLAEQLGTGEIMAQLLINRGYDTPESATRFLKMEKELLHSPYLLSDMEKAVDRILLALEKHERIVIYGDYDVDGVTSVSILYLYLKNLGADIGYYIPNRMGEGYGMSENSLDKLIDTGANLIITVDTGITALEEIMHASSRGVDVVVTDHHECRGDLPEAIAIVNPRRPDCKYPFKELAGVGVVFKLLCAFEQKRTGVEEIDAVREICRHYADLVAIGTIADVMPIKDENRLIVAYGLSQIEKTERMGLSALIAAVSKKPDGTRPPKTPKITSGFIGYTIAPRINAAGRISSASLAVELFLTDSKERAAALADQLCDINRERQTEENRIAEEAYAMIEAQEGIENSPVIVLDADKWHHGIIGIVASKITEKYGVPSILISFDGSEKTEDGSEIGKGSGRSIKGLNLVDALVHCNDLLEKYGGHELAAGLSIKRSNVEELRKRINEYASEHYSYDDRIPTLDADFEILPEEVTLETAQELRMLEPCGVSNPQPTFVMRDVTLLDITPISMGKHTKLTVKREGAPLTAMYFSRGRSDLDFAEGDKIDLFCSFDINEFNNVKTAQVIVRDARLCKAAEDELESVRNRYEEVAGGAKINPDEDFVPTRDDFAAVFTVIKRALRMGTEEMSVREMLTKLEAAGADISYVKLRFIINIFRELNVIGIEESGCEKYTFRLSYNNKRTDLEKSALLRRLRSLQREGGRS